MHAIAHDAEDRPPRDADQFVVFHGVTWTEFEIMLAIRGDRPVPRMAFLNGELELMSPSRSHEGIKTRIARLLEAYAVERRIWMDGFGSWTVKDAPAERGVEPDECYVFDREADERPDLAIEVVWTSGSLNKLEIYRGLKVPEVWVWKAGHIRIFRLEAGQYVPSERSAFLPDLDPADLERFVDAPHQSEAVFQFIDWLRRRA
jgi:Uma2 family endonuclease